MIITMLTKEDESILRGLINAKLRELEAWCEDAHVYGDPSVFRIQTRNGKRMIENLHALRRKIGLEE